VLNGLNEDWGQWRRVGAFDQELLVAQRYDAAAGKFVYRVNPNFGQTSFIGPVRQFQVQLGARVSF
jgi:hypothetical protein